MEHIEKIINVAVSASRAYNQWTQFEDWPQFMDGVEEVKQLSDTRLYWRIKVADKEAEFETTITDQIPDYRIAWHSTTGASNSGAVTFHPKGDDTTDVMLNLSYDLQGMTEHIGDALEMIEQCVTENLKNFKEFIESEDHETGTWRGRIRSGHSVKPGESYPQ